jgi:hypothetical protein
VFLFPSAALLSAAARATKVEVNAAMMIVRKAMPSSITNTATEANSPLQPDEVNHDCEPRSARWWLRLERENPR